MKIEGFFSYNASEGVWGSENCRIGSERVRLEDVEGERCC